MDERSKLVFLIEARSERPERLRVGQPDTNVPSAAMAEPAARRSNSVSSPPPANGGAAAGTERSRTLHPQGHSEHRVREPAVRDPDPRPVQSATTSLNIVPGLVGTILTMTMLIFTALSVTREIERGTMESLLAMPITPVEIMLGKVVPYLLVGFLPAGLIIGIGIGLFGVPLLGSLLLLALLSTLFITTNLSVGYTFSTIAQNQLQAMQMSMM